MKRYAQCEVDEAIAQVDRGVFTPHAELRRVSRQADALVDEVRGRL